MLLTADIGNSLIKFAVFDQTRLRSRFSIPTHRDRGHQLTLLEEHAAEFVPEVSKASICSVVPGSTNVLTDFLSRRGCSVRVISSDLDVGLRVLQEPRSSLGSDRLVNAFSAVAKYGAPVIICSFGTATTIDVVDRGKTLLGGIIAPGLLTSANALRRSTAQLPEISIEIPDRLIGNTTRSALLSGIVFGHCEMVDGLISRISRVLEVDPPVIATGGFAPLVASISAAIDKEDDTLTLDGLRLLHEHLETGGSRPV
jgi:type III pantothenate kinase